MANQRLSALMSFSIESDKLQQINFTSLVDTFA